MLKKRLKQFPDMIHVRIESPRYGDSYLLATDRGVYDALDGDGPEPIGQYKLVKVVTAERIVKVT